MVSALHEAAEVGDVAAVRCLVASGADLEEPGEGGARPLHVAACNGHMVVLETLVALGADMEAKTAEGAAPLHWAAWAGAVTEGQVTKVGRCKLDPSLKAARFQTLILERTTVLLT